MRTGSKIENPSTTVDGESRELQLLLFNFLCNLNRAPYKCRAEKWVTPPGPPPYLRKCHATGSDQKLLRKVYLFVFPHTFIHLHLKRFLISQLLMVTDVPH